MIGRVSTRIAIALVVLAPIVLQAQSRIPNVTFNYSNVFHRRCVQLTHDTIPDAAFKELDEILSTLHERWAEEGPKLLGTVVEITGQKFEFPEARFVATICSFGAMSFPPIIDMRPY